MLACCQVYDSFLLPEMVSRIASMLNYFLKYLTGPERKGLKVGSAAAPRRGNACFAWVYVRR